MLFPDLLTGGPGSATQSSSHAPRRQNTIDNSSSTKETVISGRKTPSNVESPKVTRLLSFRALQNGFMFILNILIY